MVNIVSATHTEHIFWYLREERNNNYASIVYCLIDIYCGRLSQGQ